MDSNDEKKGFSSESDILVTQEDPGIYQENGCIWKATTLQSKDSLLKSIRVATPAAPATPAGHADPWPEHKWSYRGLWCLHIRHTPFPNVYLWHITCFVCNLFVTTCMYTYHPCMLYQSTWMIDNKLSLYMDSCIIHIMEKNRNEDLAILPTKASKF